MANLNNKQLKDTYKSLLGVGTDGVGPTLQDVTDGLGNPTSLQVSETEINVNGDAGVTGTLDANDFSLANYGPIIDEDGNWLGNTGGISGSSGTSGANGASGSSGTSGIGVSGSSGTSGANGAPGTSGTSGLGGVGNLQTGDSGPLTTEFVSVADQNANDSKYIISTEAGGVVGSVPLTDMYGLFNIGAHPFDSNHWVGIGDGTLLAMEVAADFDGDMVNLQIDGGDQGWVIDNDFRMGLLTRPQGAVHVLQPDRDPSNFIGQLGGNHANTYGALEFYNFGGTPAFELSLNSANRVTYGGANSINMIAKLNTTMNFGVNDAINMTISKGGLYTTRINGDTNTGGLYLGAYATKYGTIWSTSVTPSATNFAFTATSNYTSLNAASGGSVNFTIADTHYMSAKGLGVYIGAGFGVSPSARLHVRGDGTNPIVRFEDSAGSRFLNVTSTGSATSIAFNGGTQGNILNTDGSSIEMFYGGSRASGAFSASASGLSASYFGVSKSNTSGTVTLFNVNGGFNPTSGTAVFNQMLVDGTINQTGGANGITRGIYINPTLTSAANFRAIEVATGNVHIGSSTFGVNTRVGIKGNGDGSSNFILQVTNASESRGWQYRGDGNLQFFGGMVFEPVESGGQLGVQTNTSRIFYCQGDSSVRVLEAYASGVIVRGSNGLAVDLINSLNSSAISTTSLIKGTSMTVDTLSFPNALDFDMGFQSSDSGDYSALKLNYNLDFAGGAAGNMYGMFINAYENSLKSMTHELMRANVNDTPMMVLSNDGSMTLNGYFRTGNPGGGSGEWKLGQAQVSDGVLSLDTANYIEVQINGVTYNLAIAI